MMGLSLTRNVTTYKPTVTAMPTLDITLSDELVVEISLTQGKSLLHPASPRGHADATIHELP